MEKNQIAIEQSERLALRRTKLEIPGCAGKREPRSDGSRK